VVYIIFVDVKNQFISYSFITNINTRDVNKMADIKISNLSGNDLFSDSESFLTELSDASEEIVGGALVDVCIAGTCNITVKLCGVFTLLKVVFAQE
jgi:hypothetical protein